MARFEVAALFVLLSASSLSVQSLQNFQPQSFVRERILTRQATSAASHQRNVSSPASNPEFPTHGDSLSDALNSVKSAAVDSISKAVSDEPDLDEAEIALKKRLVGERVKTYTVTLPLASSSMEGKSQLLSMGMTLCKISKGRTFGVNELNLDTLEYERATTFEKTEWVQRMDPERLGRKIDGEFQGLVVSSVVEGSAAWAAGVRAGDVLKGSSATIGANVWPKSTLEGVRSALLSRKVTSRSIQLELQRLGEGVDNQFELTLARPIGIELQETEDGHVEVTGFTPNAPKLVQYAVKIGDRVLAVDSSLGDRMWPVSTVEGVVSAVTARLPGQQITFRFERPYENMYSEIDNEARPMAIIAIQEKSAPTVSTTAPPLEKQELLKRCRDVIRRYTTGEQASEKFVNKYAVPALVADKVMDALASAGAKVDRVTLSMIMSAYLSVKQPQKAIDAFEAIVGLSANGADTVVTKVNEGQEKFASNHEALDVYTASALLKAHAMKGELSSVRRVLAAVEGRRGMAFDGVGVASWPGTGVGGTIKPDTRCYNIAMSALADGKTEESLELALQMFSMMKDPSRQSGDTLEKNLVSYNTIINGLSSRGRFEEAIDLFYTMRRAGVKPDKFSYTSLVKAAVADGDLEELIYEMREQGVAGDVVTYNTAIKSLCQQRKIVSAKKIVTLMEGSGVSPNSMTYGLLMKGLLDSGNPSAALTLFETACSDQRTVALTENVYLYTTAVTAASALGDHERALELLSRMKRGGIRPNMKTMTALVGACLSAGKPDLAVDVYHRIPEPDGYAMTQGIRALGESGRVEEALSVVSSLDNHSSSLTGKQLMLSYNSLIKSSLRAGDYELARSVLAKLMSRGHIPSKATFQTLFDSMKLFPSGQLTFRQIATADEEAVEKFKFLLFVLDSVSRRNLPCEGPLYAAILSYGLRLGGLPKKIASLLVSVKTAVDDSGAEATCLVSTWEELFQRYDEVKSHVSSPADLPCLAVRVNSRDVPNVLRAEKSLLYAQKSKARR